jgi:hypothetical protein
MKPGRRPVNNIVVGGIRVTGVRSNLNLTAIPIAIAKPCDTMKVDGAVNLSDDFWKGSRPCRRPVSK